MPNEIVNPFEAHLNVSPNRQNVLITLNSSGLHTAFPGWALAYVENEKPIPKKWRSDFYKELINDNQKYKEALEEAIRIKGVRFI